MSLLPIMMTLGGDGKKLEAPIIKEDISRTTETSFTFTISDYVGPGKLKEANIKISLATDTNWTSPIKDSIITTGFPITSFTETSLAADVQYKAKVIYTNTLGKTIESAVILITTVKSTKAPVLTEVAPTGEKTASFTITNYDGPGTLVEAIVKVASITDTTFSSPLQNTSIKTGFPLSTINVATLTGGTDYLVMVTYKNSNGVYIDSNKVSIKTAPAPIPLEAPVISKGPDTSDLQLHVFTTDYVGPGALKSISVSYTDINTNTTYTDLITSQLADKIDLGIYITANIVANNSYKVKVIYINDSGSSINSNEIIIKAAIDPVAFSWQLTTDTKKSGWTAVENGLCLFVMVGDSGLIGYTDDCKTVVIISTITNLPSGVTLSNLDFTRVAFKGNETTGVFIAMTIDGHVIKSTDGKNWVYVTKLSITNVNEQYHALNYTGGKFVAISSEHVATAAAKTYLLSKTVYSSDDGLTWVKNVSEDTTLTITSVAPKPQYIKTISHDGFNWVTVTGVSVIWSSDLVTWKADDVHNTLEYLSISNDGKYFITTCIGKHATPIVRVSDVLYRDKNGTEENKTTIDINGNINPNIVAPTDFPVTWSNNKHLNGYTILLPLKSSLGLKSKDPFKVNPLLTDPVKMNFIQANDLWFKDDYTDILDYKDIAFGTIKSKSGISVKMFTLVANKAITGTATDKLIKYTRA